MKRLKNAAKYSLYILLSAFIVSCSGGNKWEDDIDQYNVIIIEECEYIFAAGHGIQSLVHKGNCKSEVHNCR